MLLSRLLTQPDELVRFSAHYQHQSHGVGVQSDYLQRAQVRVFYSLFRPQTYLAGFVINARAPYRYFTAPGNDARQKALDDHQLQEADLVEIGAIWFSRYSSVFRSIHRLQFYVWMMYDAWFTGQPVILGGSFIGQIQGQQRAFLPTLIYQGLVQVGDYAGTLQLYVGARAGMWPRLIRALLADHNHRHQKPAKPTVNQPVIGFAP